MQRRTIPEPAHRLETTTVIDCAYLAGTALFFALMLGYVHGCDHLSRASAADAAQPEEPHP
jgi:hypothetical protein